MLSRCVSTIIAAGVAAILSAPAQAQGTQPGTAPADIEHGLLADPNDLRRIVRPHIHVTDAAYSVVVAKTGIDANGVPVESPWRGGQGGMAHPSAHALLRGIEHQALFAPCRHGAQSLTSKLERSGTALAGEPT